MEGNALSANDPDLQPELDEVYQVEPEMGREAPVGVAVVGPVRTQALPLKAMATRTVPITTTPVKVLQADHRRASATLMAIGQNMLVAFNTASASDPLAVGATSSRMALWPQNVPFEITGDTEVWVASATGTATLTVITGMWATGEDGRS